MRRAGLLIVAVLLAASAPEAVAQESVFGIRGLGFLGRPVSARSAGMGGGEALFDGSSAVNPASLASWHSLAGWAVGAGSQRSVDAGTGTVSLTSMRFPLFGFAAPIGRRIVVGVTVSDFLNRNWDVQQTDTVMPRDSAVPVTDRTKSIGGVSDLRFAAAYWLTDRIALGAGFHVLTGSVQTAIERDFPSDPAYRTFVQITETQYRSTAASFGLFVTPVPRLVLAASARFNGRLRSDNPGASARVHLPTELSGGIYLGPLQGITVTSFVSHADWSVASGDLEAAGQAGARDVWSLGIGAQVSSVKLFGHVAPLRAGYRWRQLPFLVPEPNPALPTRAVPLSEHAVSLGIGFLLAGGRANLDAALEGGSRTAGSVSERFTTMLVGVSVFP
jgi:hypothetical protein